MNFKAKVAVSIAALAVWAAWTGAIGFLLYLAIRWLWMHTR